MPIIRHASLAIPDLPIGISSRTGTYRYIVTDLSSNRVIGELEMTNVSYSRKLSAAGEASADFTVPTSLVDDVRRMTAPGRTGLYILRDNFPMWGGIIWKRSYSRGSRKASLVCSGFESYFDKRFQKVTRVFSATDQLSIARTLLDTAPSALGIDVSTATSPVKRDRVMFDYEFKTMGEELAQLSNLENGFDWNVNVYIDNSGVLRRRLDFGYPYIGIDADDTGLLFEYPGNISDFSLSEDADAGGNTVYAIGGGEGEDQLQAVATDSTSITNGFPVLETSRSYKTVVSPSTLQGHANKDLNRLRVPVTVTQVDVRPGDDPALGTYVPGDYARFIIDDPWIGGRLDFKSRITGFSVQVADAGGPESVTLSFDITDRVTDETTVSV